MAEKKPKTTFTKSGGGKIGVQYQDFSGDEPKDQGTPKSITPASLELDRRQLASYKLVKRVLADEVAGQRRFEGAKFSLDDRDAVCATVRQKIGARGGADDLDRLTKAMLSRMEAGDRAGALALITGRPASLVNASNAIGASPLWEPPSAEEAGDADPAELAAKITAR